MAIENVALSPAVAFDEPAPAIEYVAPAPAVSLHEPAPVIDDVAPAPAVTCTAPSPVTEYVAPAPAITYTVFSPVMDHVAPAPAVTFATPSPVIEYVASTPVNEFIASPPAVTFSTPSQQFPVYAVAAVTTGASLDTTSFVHSPCPITDVEASASNVVGSLLPLGEFTAPVHQAQFVAEQERVQQHTAEQIMHVPVHQIQEQSMEGVQVVPKERFLGRIVEQIVDTPVPQGVKEVVSATVDELTAAAPADELDEARQRIRLRSECSMTWRLRQLGSLVVRLIVVLLPQAVIFQHTLIFSTLRDSCGPSL